jgi:hypothetical protein
MGGQDVDIERQACSIHTDRQAVERCAECGRPACLACAVPVRGRVLCTSCAARELGERTPAEELAPVRSRRPDLVAGALLLAALVLTTPPWHRIGPLTEWFTAWGLEPEPWPTAAVALLMVALVAAVLPGVLRLPSWRTQAAVYGIADLLAGLAVLRSIMGALVFFRHSPIPFLVLALTAGVAIVAIVRIARAPRAAPAGRRPR